MRARDSHGFDGCDNDHGAEGTVIFSDVAHTATLIARWQGGWYETDGTTDVPAYVARKVDEWLAKEGK